MLSTKKCKQCENGMTQLTDKEIKTLSKTISNEWSVIDGEKLSRSFKFKTFSEAIAFINKIARLAEQKGHHPDMHNYYNKLVVELSTHSISGLSENDFIIAEKIDRLSIKTNKP